MTEPTDRIEQIEPIDPTPAPEPAASPASATPAAAGGPAIGLSTARGRWLVALVVAGGALAVAIAAALLLGSRPTPEALTYVPGDAAVVAELRLDLPGDQLQKVGNLLARFPGFKDQSTLTQKIDETLGRLVGDASNGTINYATQVQPWLAGPLFVAGTPPTGAAAGSGSQAAEAFVIVATTDGSVTCDPLFKNANPTTETYQGAKLVTAPDSPVACAIDKRFGLLGSPAMVKAALDAHAAHTGMDSRSEYRTARDALGGDRLATLYVAKAAMTTAANVPGLQVGAVPVAGLSRLPEWFIAGINAEDDALVADLVTAPIPAAPAGSAASGSPLPTLPPAHASRIAPLLPADTAALVDVHGAGIALQNALAQLRGNPSLGPSLGQIDSSLALLGGAGSLVGWIDDVGIVVEPDGTSVTGGIVLLAADEATATAKADQIRGFLTLAGLGGQADIRETTIAGTKVTTVGLGNLRELLKASGAKINLPVDFNLALSFASKDKALIIGAGEGFVRSILETTSGASLADSAGYKHAIGRSSAENLGQIYVGATSVLALVETAIPEADRPRFTSDFEPYLGPFEAIVVTTTTDQGRTHVRFVATVK